jgi:hypothetical protein
MNPRLYGLPDDMLPAFACDEDAVKQNPDRLIHLGYLHCEVDNNAAARTLWQEAMRQTVNPIVSLEAAQIILVSCHGNRHSEDWRAAADEAYTRVTQFADAGNSAAIAFMRLTQPQGMAFDL